MNRRKSIGLLGLGSLFLSQNAYSFGQKIDPNFIDSFLVRWDYNRIYTFEILEAMPESKFEFQPKNEMMPFSKLYTHIGYSLDVYAGVFDGKIPNEEPETSIKKAKLEYLNRCLDHFETAYKSLNKNELYTKNHFYPDKEPWKEFYVFDIIMLAYNHTVHHLGQATTYLRLNGITPPRYRF
jgi:uncharacterized damage-inducible protein DinB